MRFRLCRRLWRRMNATRCECGHCLNMAVTPHSYYAVHTGYGSPDPWEE